MFPSRTADCETDRFRARDKLEIPDIAWAVMRRTILLKSLRDCC